MRWLTLALLLPVMLPVAAEAAPRQCLPFQQQLTACQTELQQLQGAYATCQAQLQTCQSQPGPVETVGPTIQLFTTGTNQVGTQVVVPFKGATDWVMRLVDTAGNIAADLDYTVELLPSGLWMLMVSSISGTPGVGQMDLEITNGNQVFRQPIVVEVR